jgi:hypothetical protein
MMRPYSYRSESTGSATAALMDWKTTVAQAMILASSIHLVNSLESKKIIPGVDAPSTFRIQQEFAF